jgi:hypothetical protein
LNAVAVSPSALPVLKTQLCGLRSLAHLKATSFMSGLAFAAALGSGVGARSPMT